MICTLLQVFQVYLNQWNSDGIVGGKMKDHMDNFDERISRKDETSL